MIFAGRYVSISNFENLSKIRSGSEKREFLLRNAILSVEKIISRRRNHQRKAEKRYFS
jgi:hypothetical protein